MATAALPKHCAIDGLAEQLAAAGALGSGWNSTVLFMPEHSFLHCSALTFLCAWGRQQRRSGRDLLIRGDQAAIERLERLELHEHLGLAYRKDAGSGEMNPFVPLRLISNEQDVMPAAALTYDLVRKHFDNAASFLPALQWALSEILDNVLRHAEAVEPGAVYSEYFPREHRLDVAICDLGRGIRASLGETVYLYSDGHAITQAIRRGVTRSEDIGQGNGLAGVVEIVKRNHGSLHIWTGDAVYRVVRGEEKGFLQIPKIPGTGVAFSLDTHVPVDLRDTWIAGRGSEFLAAGALIGTGSSTPPAIARPEVFTRQDSAANVIDIAQECTSTAMRAPAERLRRRVLQEFSESTAPLILDFSSVENATSSFLDELLGRLARELGMDTFHQRFRITGMSDLVERMANVVIGQRVEGLSGPKSNSPEDGTK
jgi:hypothetical protein